MDVFSLELREMDNWRQKGLNVVIILRCNIFAVVAEFFGFHDREIYLELPDETSLNVVDFIRRDESRTRLFLDQI